MSSLSHNPYDKDHATLTPKEQSEAWWRGSSDRFVKPFTEDVRFTSCNHLMEGYNSRKLDEATWAKVAFHLAAGVPIIKIAEHYKLSRSTIWRALGRSHNLRRRVAEERALMRREADSRFVAMRELVVDTLYRAVADGNMRATLWAADRLGLGVELLQQAERPPKPGYARMPHSWLPSAEKTAAILADLDTPADSPAPLPVPEECPAMAAPRKRHRRVPLHPHGFEPPHPARATRMDAPAALQDTPSPDAFPEAPAADDAPAADTLPDPLSPDLTALAPEPVPAINVETAPTADIVPDPVPHLPPLDADPMGQTGDPLPDFPADLRWRGKPTRSKVRASAPPVPHHPGPSLRLTRGSYSIHRRAAPRVLAWILHNSLPIADGVDGASGLSAARWAVRSRWMAWGDKPPMDLCDRGEITSRDVSQGRRRHGDGDGY